MRTTLWKDEYFVLAYEYAKQGMTDRAIGSALGVTGPTFISWKKKRRALRIALKKARAGDIKKNGGETFGEYIYKRLSPELKALWDQLHECENLPNGLQRVEALLRNAGQDARMNLFLHALTARNFNASEACRAVNITRKTMEEWAWRYPDFSRLLDEMHQAKKDFFEEGLVKAVKGGDVSATIFANKTLNRDRGYGDKIEVEHKGTIQHNHAVISIAELDLDVDTRRLILERVRARKQPQIVGEAKQ